MSKPTFLKYRDSGVFPAPPAAGQRTVYTEAYLEECLRRWHAYTAQGWPRPGRAPGFHRGGGPSGGTDGARLPGMAALPIEDYVPADGDHLCSLWTDHTVDRAAGSIYLSGSGARPTLISDAFRDTRAQPGRDPTVDPRLELLSTDDIHFGGVGLFSPERMRGFWQSRADEVSRTGQGHWRAVAEMHWILRRRPGTEEAPLFESSLNPALEGRPLSVICQYGSSRFDGETVLTMALSHPLVVIGRTVHRNPFAVEHAAFPRRFELLCGEAAAALLPIWRHFAHVQTSVRALAEMLCTSLPSVIGAQRVYAALPGAPPLELDVEEDRLKPGTLEGWKVALDELRSGHQVAKLPALEVRVIRRNGDTLLGAFLGNGTVLASVHGGGTDERARRFAGLAWDAAAALHAMSLGETEAGVARNPRTLS